MATRRQYILTPDADRAGVESAIRVDMPTFSLNVPVYTASDATPRPITHWHTDFSKAALPSIETPITGCKDVFPDSYFEEHFIPPVAPNYPATRLADLGLTTSAT